MLHLSRHLEKQHLNLKMSARFRNTSAIKKIMKPAVGVSLDVNKDELIPASLMCSENQNVLVQLLYNDNKS